MFADKCLLGFIDGIVVLRWKFTFYEALYHECHVFTNCLIMRSKSRQVVQPPNLSTFEKANSWTTTTTNSLKIVQRGEKTPSPCWCKEEHERMFPYLIKITVAARRCIFTLNSFNNLRPNSKLQRLAMLLLFSFPRYILCIVYVGWSSWLFVVDFIIKPARSCSPRVMNYTYSQLH